MYDNNYQNIELTGEVVNGLREGVWKGSIIVPDSINYQYLFKNGHILSSIGYDKRGAAYPFKIAHERANYRTGQITFVDVLRSHIKIPKDTTRRRMSVDTSSLSFLVEKDGHIDEFSILGETIAPLKETVFAALRQCDHWSPNKLYGITFRTRITIPIKEISEYSNGYYVKLINYTEKILKDN